MILTDDAKALAGVFWSLGTAKVTRVNFRLAETKPTPRAMAAFENLVENGYIEREEMPGGGFRFAPLKDMREFGEFKENATWPMTESIK